MGPSYRSGPGFCPTINATESQEILVSSGIKKAIRVKVHIIGVCQKPSYIIYINYNFFSFLIDVTFFFFKLLFKILYNFFSQNFSILFILFLTRERLSAIHHTNTLRVSI